MHIAILGRQPALSIAELERLYGSRKVSWFGESSALVDGSEFEFARLGGSLKGGRVVLELPGGNWRRISTAIVEHYLKAWQATEHKLTLGISTYGLNVTSRDVQGTGIILKKKLRAHDVSVRLIPNQDIALSTATSHHNKLGLSPHRIELLVVRGASGRIVIAESVGVQNITALAARDQARPHTDAFVGMLPPKLARMMVNLTVGTMDKRIMVSGAGEPASAPLFEGDVPVRASQAPQAEHSSPVERPPRKDGADAGEHSSIILDPFCGTGVVLQEALLLDYNAYGTDLSEKMVDYSQKNLAWLTSKFHISHANYEIAQGDAMTHTWPLPIDAVATETYLGQPFSAPPSPAKLTEVRGNCDHIISEFLKNLATQIAPGTPLCIAVPAWNDGTGHFTHLPLINRLDKLGYHRIELRNVRPDQLLYYREGQVVARELLLLTRA